MRLGRTKLTTLTNLLKWIQHLQHVSNLLETERKKDHYLFDDITQNVHFTFTESQQLKNFLIRWDVFFPKRSLSSEIKDLNDSKSILDYLESSLNNHEIKWE